MLAPLMGRWLATGTLAAVTCLAEAASGATIEVAAVDAAGHPWGAPLTLEATETSTGVVRALGRVQGRATLELPAGRWTLEARGERAWGIAGDIPVEAADGVLPCRILIHRTAVVAGPLEATPFPSAIVARIRTPPDREACGQSVPVSLAGMERRCTVAESRWRCELPVGRWDVRLYSEDHAPVYLWSLGVGVEGREDLRLALKAGPSLAGFVDPVLPSNPSAVVQLALTDGRAVVGADRQPAFVASPNSRGFFQLAGLAPGRFLAQLVAGDSVIAQSEELEVRAKGETLLGAPLSPRQGTGWVRISPPEDAQDRPWTVRLEGPSANLGFATDATGRVLLPYLPRGEYRLYVLDSKPSQWHLSSFSVDDVQPTVLVELEAVRVRGEVRLAGKPLPCRVLLLARGAHVPFVTDDQGRFEGLLPLRGESGQEIRARVHALSPVVERVVNEIRLDFGENRVAELVIDLPNGQLEGTVVDPQGRLMRESVRVTLDRSDGKGVADGTSLLTDSGTFTVTGLEAGRYAVSAASRESETVAPEEVEISSEKVSSVRLVLPPSQAVEVRVVDESGGMAIAGAHVLVLPADGLEVGSATEVSDAEGRVRVLLPRDTRAADVVVAAPGFGTHFRRYALEAGGEVLAPLTRARGVLSVAKPPAVPGLAESWQAGPFIVHRGATLHAGLLASFSPETPPGEAPGVLSVPNLEPGTYSACVASDSAGALSVARTGRTQGLRCAGGDLVDGATLDVDPLAAP